MTLDEAREILAALEREGVEYVLIGSMAMAAQGLIRATRVAAFFVPPTRDNVERLKRALKAVFADPRIDEISGDDLAGEYPAVAYVPPHGRYSLDIISQLGEAFRYEDLEWEVMVVEGTPVRVATPRMLYRMKKDTVRPQDRVDAAWIQRTFNLEEA